VPYSVLPPQSDSPNWKVLDDRGDVVFWGLRQQCEEWLDLADCRAETFGETAEHPMEGVTTRLPIFELASALLRRFRRDCAGEVRVPGELPAILLLMIATLCLSSQFVWPAVAEQVSLNTGTSDSTCASQHQRSSAGTRCESSCSSSLLLDIACDAADESY